MDVKKVREAFGVSQIELARKACVSRFRLYQVERGYVELRPDELAAIQRVLKPEAAKAVLAAEMVQA